MLRHGISCNLTVYILYTFLQNVQTGSGAQTASYSPTTEGFPLRLKRPEREADHSSPPIVEVQNKWSYTAIPVIAFMAYVQTT